MEDCEALKIHGYHFSSESGSESDSGKSEFDLDYYKALPPVHRIDPTKVVVLKASRGKTNLNVASGSSEQVKKANYLHHGIPITTTFDPTTSVKVHAASSTTAISKGTTSLRNTGQACHNPHLSNTGPNQARPSHKKIDVRKPTSALGTKQLSQNRQSHQPLLLNPATLPVNRERGRSSATVIDQPVRNAPNRNASSAASVASNNTDINLMETEESKCFSCILCLVKCCVCDCDSK